LASHLRTNFGLHDRCPVATETFTQWVIEDSFCGERPPLEEVGVKFVTNARPFVRAKTRLLNGSHCAIAFLGHGLGHRTSALAMRDPLVREAVAHMMAEEIAPILGDAPEVDVSSYQRALLVRLADEAVEDPIARLRQRGSIRMRNYLLPSLGAALSAGRPHGVLLLVVAAWIHHLRTYEGSTEALNDPLGGLLCSLARLGGDDPRAVLSVTSVFGDLRSHQPTVRALRLALRHIRRRGMRSALSAATGPQLAPADRVVLLPAHTRWDESAIYQKGA
jgi:mannitol-1-phosphate/altronate dehydrogenase